MVYVTFHNVLTILSTLNSHTWPWSRRAFLLPFEFFCFLYPAKYVREGRFGLSWREGSAIMQLYYLLNPFILFFFYNYYCFVLILSFLLASITISSCFCGITALTLGSHTEERKESSLFGLSFYFILFYYIFSCTESICIALELLSQTLFSETLNNSSVQSELDEETTYEWWTLRNLQTLASLSLPLMCLAICSIDYLLCWICDGIQYPYHLVLLLF